jgi:molybdate transport system ATP-binding protein
MTTFAVRFEHDFGGFQLKAQFEVPASGIICLFGPSGSGKTSVLRCIAGLQRPRHGMLRIGEHVWQDDTTNLFVPPHRRPAGYVFQEASLFPHLSVRRNVEYGQRRVPRQNRRITFDTAVEWLGLHTLLHRDVSTLSGGERQRVAIARALSTSPKLLLMDEPLSALDETSRQEIFPYLERLHQTLSIPIVLVTHARSEVNRLADYVVIMKDGTVVRSGPAAETLTTIDIELNGDPRETTTLIEATVAEHDREHHLTRLDSVLGPIWLLRLEKGTGARVRVQLAARDISLGLERELHSSILNQFEMIVHDIRPAGKGQALVSMAAPDSEIPSLHALITEKSRDHLRLAPRVRVCARVKGVSVAR